MDPYIDPIHTNRQRIQDACNILEEEATKFNNKISQASSNIARHTKQIVDTEATVSSVRMEKPEISLAVDMLNERLNRMSELQKFGAQFTELYQQADAPGTVSDVMKADAERLSKCNEAYVAKIASITNQIKRAEKDLKSEEVNLEKAKQSNEEATNELREMQTRLETEWNDHIQIVEKTTQQLNESLRRQREDFVAYGTKMDNSMAALKLDSIQYSADLSSTDTFDDTPLTPEELEVVNAIYAKIDAQSKEHEDVMAEQDQMLIKLTSDNHDQAAVQFYKKKLATKEKKIAALKMGDAKEAEERAREAAKAASTKRNAKEEIEESQQRLEKQKKELADETKFKRKLLNELEDMRGQIRVFCHIKPTKDNQQSDYTCENEFSVTVKSDTDSDKPKQYAFTRVFDGSSSFDAVLETVSETANKAMHGFNVCHLAYGCSSTGKFYTMLGTPERPGIVRHAIKQLFAAIEASENKARFKYRLKMYMADLYGEKLLDLLGGGATHTDQLVVMKNAANVVNILDVTRCPIATEAEAVKLFETGIAKRRAALTKLGTSKSRSHLCVSLLVNAEMVGGGARRVLVGKLSVVVLTGADRQIAAAAATSAEAKALNAALCGLGDCVNQLAGQSKGVSYHTHTLCRLMEDVLGGNCKTYLHAFVSPETAAAADSQDTMTFAQRVKGISNFVEAVSDSPEMYRLKREIRRQQAAARART